MKRHNIPTAAYAEFTKNNYQEGLKYISGHPLPVVIKADGLAAGKGVIICQTSEEALSAFESMIVQDKFGSAGNKVVVEEFLQGIELSMFVLTDGKDYVLLPEAKDYKRIGEGDSGLNTGGMGAVSPVPFADNAFVKKAIQNIIAPTIAGLQKDKLEYKGFVFFGLMNNNDEPYVIEYNCRMGDPETEVVIPRIKNDFIELLVSTSQERINEIKILTDERTAVAIVAVSGGYPGEYKKGKIINGLKKNIPENTIIFHAGTKLIENNIVTDGGRVLVMTSFAHAIPAAAALSVQALEQIYFDEIYFRRDIGYEFN